MRLFLTGATGFLGSHVMARALKNGHEVAVLLRPGGNRERIGSMLGKVQVIEGELGKSEEWEKMLQAYSPAGMIHLAWEGVGNSSRDNPEQFNNVEHARNLVNLAKRIGAKHWIGTGSQAEYGRCQGAIGEEISLNPTTLYGCAKAAAYFETSSLCRLWQIRFCWLRIFSTYGPGDDPSWMIPSLILQLLRGQRPSLTGCEQKWDYLYAEDAAEAILRVAENREARGVFNLGSGRARPLKEIVGLVRDMVNPDATLGIGDIPYRPDQVMHLEAKVSRLREAVGWEPTTNLEDGLRRTVAYYQSRHNLQTQK